MGKHDGELSRRRQEKEKRYLARLCAVSMGFGFALGSLFWIALIGFVR